MEILNDKSMLDDFVELLFDLRRTGETIQLHSGVRASKTMTSPIYPPQGGSSEVRSIKLSPEIKRLLTRLSHRGENVLFLLMYSSHAAYCLI